MKAGTATLLIAAGAALDLATKAWARAALEPYGPAGDFLPFVSLRLTFNEGVSFSLLASDGEVGRALLIGLTAILTLGLVVWAYRSQGWQRAALAVAAAGAVGNLIDRAARWSVTDFLGLHFGSWHPFVFNLADVWISLGVGLLLLGPYLPARGSTAEPFRRNGAERPTPTDGAP
ncbi:signal peptidase II [Sphingomonas paucimobilis]|uniref:Lipoprotein signal peptidase n=1 Tax=Sphingomonas paucimobilis TaxID=13689 RepID=A0A7Y2KSG9_SPHPI|nr:signal peptidase II [Sphingomonas paucimobilis]NNG58792.1 signal peptidase II [Sphingomonas paucimobilis]